MQNTGSINSGRLFVVSTPIGNLKDITFRAIETLQSVDIIACEDTRNSLVLLNKYDIKKKLISFHKYSTKGKGIELIDYLRQGKDIALITDAGTPGLSDPGAFLVRLALENTIKVIPIPGPSALTSALSISGMCENGFIFIGFMPSSMRQRNSLIRKYFAIGLPVIFYESPKRLLNTLRAIKDNIGNNNIFVFKELTKVYENSIFGPVDNVIEKLKQGIIKGEYTIIADTIESKAAIGETVVDRKALLEAAAVVTGLSKREVYKKLFTK